MLVTQNVTNRLSLCWYYEKETDGAVTANRAAIVYSRRKGVSSERKHKPTKQHTKPTTKIQISMAALVL